MSANRSTPQADRAKRVLAAWTALETLSPRSYKRPSDLAEGDERRVAPLSAFATLPWMRDEPVPAGKRLWYQVVLGSLRLDQVARRVGRTAVEEHDVVPPEPQRAVIAAALLDSDGMVVADGLTLSSCAWGVPLALDGRFDALSEWPRVEPQLLEKLSRQLSRCDSDGQPAPLDWSSLQSVHAWLVGELRLPADVVEPPSVAVRIYQYRAASDPPDAMLLNSFFLGDLNAAAERVTRGQVPPALARYLGLREPEAPVNLFAHADALEDAAAPARIPLAAWPSPGGNPLVLLQQVAVNLARAELVTREGIVAINGPPGTGKTTLLRDLIAACVLDRASAMAAFDNPNMAFQRSHQNVSVGLRGAIIEPHALHASLTGHEVLVASSNNKAVENISKELPASGAIGAPNLRYFSSISDELHNPSPTDADASVAERASDRLTTWGIIAAVLGNGANRHRFRQVFWWDKDYSFQNYLRAACGQPVAISFEDQENGRSVVRPPRVIEAEDAPSDAATALARWQRAKEQFVERRREVEAELEKLEAIRMQCKTQLAAERAFQQKRNTLISAPRKLLEDLAVERAQNERRIRAAREDYEACASAAAPHLAARPSVLQTLVSTHHARRWRRIYRPIAAKVKDAARELRAAERERVKLGKAEARATQQLADAEASLDLDRFELERGALALRPHRARIGSALVDGAFFAREHAEVHMTTPWLSSELQRKREQLFCAAIAVHKAFIDAAAEPILHNLGVLLDAFAGRAPSDPHRARLLPDLWSTLFLVVPVVSTTFASVERMLTGLPPRSIGWLLIDEAGQAIPQAAVGALGRAKRAVIVGDPMQVPPVVTVPERWIGEIGAFFDIDRGTWLAPEASLQTIADHASRFQAEFNAKPVRRRVGIPLLVHRRCDEPMFGISNRIAYDGQMVRAKTDLAPDGENSNEPSISDVLGPSTWWDIDGTSNGNFCNEEAQFAMECLTRLADAGVSKPDVFIISPFRQVVTGLKAVLRAEAKLFRRLDLEPEAWLKDRVGTIHTAQGREAEAIFLILGAPTPERAGARNWATRTPNILNVAVSRAKRRLYVIGSRHAWAPSGAAIELARAIEHARADRPRVDGGAPRQRGAARQGRQLDQR